MSNFAFLRLVLMSMGDDAPDYDESGDVALREHEETLAPPPKYQVNMLNDDYTPMEFVVEVLEGFFSMSREKATNVMITVHTQGKAACGVFTKDVAETKTAQVIQYARDNDYPLLCEIEPTD